MIETSLRQRFIAGLLLVAAGLGSLLFAQLYTDSLDPVQSMFPFGLAKGALFVWVAGNVVATSAAGKSSTKRPFVAAICCTSLALLQYYGLPWLFDSEDPSSLAIQTGRLLSIVSPLALCYASMTILGWAMVALADEMGLVYRQKQALQFVLGLGVLTACEIFRGIAEGRGSETLFQHLEWMRFGMLILGTIQMSFLVLLIGILIRQRPSSVQSN